MWTGESKPDTPHRADANIMYAVSASIVSAHPDSFGRVPELSFFSKKMKQVVADIVLVASIYKCRLVEEWKFSWYRAAIGFYVAWGHFWDQEQYYQKTKHGA